VWGKNDPFFTPAGAHAFERDNPNATVKLLDGGHFVLEEAAETIAAGKLTAHVARWVEYGHRMIRGGRSRLLPNGKTRGPGKQIGFVDAHPFIRPAYEATRQEVISTICTTLTTELEKAGNTKGTT